MGLVVNKLIDSLTLPELLDQLGIAAAASTASRMCISAGRSKPAAASCCTPPTTPRRARSIVGSNMALTATLDILRAIGRGEGPRRSLLALGYAGWGPGQLDAEIQANGWLHVAADEGIVFGDDSRRNGCARSASSASTPSRSRATPATPRRHRAAGRCGSPLPSPCATRTLSRLAGRGRKLASFGNFNIWRHAAPRQVAPILSPLAHPLALLG